MARLSRDFTQKEKVTQAPTPTITGVGETIEGTVQHYYQVKARESVVKKEIKEDQTFIKKYFKDNKIEVFEINGIKATVRDAEKVTFNKEALLVHIKKLMKTKDKKEVKGLVKRTEYVDESILEDLIYREILTPDEIAALAEFQDVKITQTLNIKGPKKAK